MPVFTNAVEYDVTISRTTPVGTLDLPAPAPFDVIKPATTYDIDANPALIDILVMV